MPVSGGLMAAARRHPLAGYGASLISVAAVTLLIAALERRAHLPNSSMLYLVAVLSTATVFGSAPAIFAALASFLVFNWFFIDPVHTLVVADPEEWLALLLFLVTAVITGQLAAGQRNQAREAQQREREAVVLYDVVRLMRQPSLDQALTAVAERLRSELRLGGVAIELTGEGGVEARASAGDAAALHLARQGSRESTRVLGEGPAPTSRTPAGPGRWVRIVPASPPPAARPRGSEALHVVPIRARDRKVGGIVLLGRGTARFTSSEDRLLSAVAAQLGAAVDRIRFEWEANEAEVLRRTNEVKSALLSAVSHDLRTPLASIIASAGSLRQSEIAWTEQERQDFAEAIEQEAQRLNRIVGNLLDLSRIEAGILQPDIGFHDLGSLVDDVLARLRLLAIGHEITVAIPDDLPPLPLDYVYIDQALSNLIENAVRHTAPGTHILVSACRQDGEVLVEVADQGPGVPAAVLPHVFDAFYRGEQSRPKGTGLGLAIARGLVEAHGGRMWAANRPDGGAVFAFTLPVVPPGDAAAATP